ncbi:PQQ-binding-like beta-propeller repeat protein [Haloarchaeobius sp. TZWWS8]|uniref:outer membrane protein assembly factor BamB family protein n=1 Tax=Haloarchaeobius sp. TZWWS8 TaxID=3446121 RepID=UPI003EBCD2C6
MVSSGPPTSQSPPSRSSRRAFLAAAGTTLTTGLAGCNALSSGDAAGAFSDAGWHQFGNDATNTNHVAGGAPEPTTRETLATGGWPEIPPVVNDGVVYFARDHGVVAVETDGDEKWSRSLDDEQRIEVSGAPALDPDRGRLYVPTRLVPRSNGPDPAPASVTVLSLEDGAALDEFRVGDERTYGVSIVDGDVYARSATSCVRLGPDGTERWRHTLDPLVYDEYNLGDDTATQVVPAVTDDAVYVPDRDALVKLDRESGEERWRVDVDTVFASSVVDEAGVIQTGWRETVAVDHSGEVRWRRDLGCRSVAAVSDGDVYVVPGDLHELDEETGETNWQTHVSSEGTAAPVVTDDDVIVVSGNVHAFRRDVGGLLAPDRERWTRSSAHASAYVSPVVAAGHIFVVGNFGLQALRRDSEN